MLLLSHRFFARRYSVVANLGGSIAEGNGLKTSIVITPKPAASMSMCLGGGAKNLLSLGSCKADHYSLVQVGLKRLELLVETVVNPSLFLLFLCPSHTDPISLLSFPSLLSLKTSSTGKGFTRLHLSWDFVFPGHR